MQHLIELHNFSSVMAILGGLSNSAVLRLKNTKKELSKHVVKKVAQLEDQMSPINNYRNLRELLKVCRVVVGSLCCVCVSHHKANEFPPPQCITTHGRHARVVL